MTKYRRIDPEISRRKFVNMAIGAAAGISGLSFITIVGSAKPVVRETPDKMPASAGDILVWAEGTEVGKPLDPKSLEKNPARAYPQGKDKDGNTIIKRGPLDTNMVLVSKFPPEAFKDPTNIEATDQGIVAYSAICMHLGCPVAWENKEQLYLCPCHSGQYDPKAGCKVVGGPPPRPLPQLPIKVEGNQIVVTGTYLAPPYGISEHDFEEYKEKAKGAGEES